jgi:hypothetical protein
MELNTTNPHVKESSSAHNGTEDAKIAAVGKKELVGEEHNFIAIKIFAQFMLIISTIKMSNNLIWKL